MDYSVRKGDQLVLRARASIVTRMRALVTVDFKDGPRTFPIQLKSTADRQAVDKATDARMPHDGIVTGCHVEGLQSRERGQVFAEVWVGEKSTLVARNWLTQGYLHQARNLALGYFEDPTDGMGFLIDNPLIDATAVGSDDLLNLTVPTNANWLLHHLWIEYKATATVGTRTVIGRTFTEDSETMGQVWAAQNVTASQTLRARIGGWDMELGGDVQVERDLQSPMPFKEDMIVLQVIDTAGIENSDTVEFRGLIEEHIHD